jgi:hypothetical protein
MIGSLTFIIVALRCTENSTPCALASATCSGQERLQRSLLHDGGVDDLARLDGEALERRRRPVRGHVLDRQRRRLLDRHRRLGVRKSPPLIVATWLLGR